MGYETGMGLYTVLVWDWHAGDVYRWAGISWNTFNRRGTAAFVSVVFLLREVIRHPPASGFLLTTKKNHRNAVVR